MIVIRGIESKIAEELKKLIPKNEEFGTWPRGENPKNADKYLFCQGLLKEDDIYKEHIQEMFWANAGQIVNNCEYILENNPKARICIIGSESGFSGSYNKIYAISKAAIHKYIETRQVGPDQQLIGIAPSIIEDAGMTKRRIDKGNLNLKRQNHPKGRFLRSEEVAKLVHFCLYVDEGYLNNTVIRMHGGLNV